MKKTTKIINIIEEIKKKTYRETYNIHAMMTIYGVVVPKSRYNLIDSLIDACLLVKSGKGYKVVEHKEKKKSRLSLAIVK